VAEGQIWTVGDKPWYETALPEGPARTLAANKKYANPAVMATSYAELERINASRDDSKMVRIPDENATPQDWDAVYTKLGRLKDPAGYKDAVKWGDNADPQMVEFASNMAFKLGLSPKAVESTMLTEWNSFVAKANAQAQQKSEQEATTALAAIKTEWKGDFDANQARGQQVLKALDKAGFSDADLASVEKAIGIPAVVKLLATIGKLSGEGSLSNVGGSGGGSGDPSTLSPEQAKGEIAKLATDDAFQKVYMNKQDPGQKDAAERMRKLYEKAGPLMGGAGTR
jgi:hypothetical protein